MKALIIFLVLSACARGSEIAASWVKNPPIDIAVADNPRIDEANLFEIPVSKLDLAVFRDLAAVPYVEIDEKTGRQYLGPRFVLADGERAILLRAVYVNGGAGGFTAFRTENDGLWLRHYSLGSLSSFQCSAVIVILKYMPKAVFISVGVSE